MHFNKMMSVVEAAAKHLDLYCATLANGEELFSPKDTDKETKARIQEFAESFGPLFFPNAIPFGVPEPIIRKSNEDIVTAIKWRLGRYMAKGLGFTVELKSSRIESISDYGNGVGSAICFAKYTFRP